MDFITNNFVDNSGWSPYTVAQTVLEAGIVVDAVIVGGSEDEHKGLRSLAHCSGIISAWVSFVFLTFY